MKNTKIIDLETQIENLKNDLISIDSLKTEIEQFNKAELYEFDKSTTYNEIYPNISKFLLKTKSGIQAKTAKIEIEITKLTQRIEDEKQVILNIVCNALDNYAAMSSNDDLRDFIQDIIITNYGSKKD